MDSSTNRKQTEEQKQAEIRRQIALLQAQLKDDSDVVSNPPSTPKKRKRDSQTVLAAATPSPKKKKASKDLRTSEASSSKHHQPPMQKARSNTNRNHATTQSAGPHPVTTIRPSMDRSAASSVLSKLATFTSPSNGEDAKKTTTRTTTFHERAALLEMKDRSMPTVATRGEDLALVEDLELGPYDHKAPFDDPHFEKLEPNSGIRLSSRSIPYDDFQDYLRGRYYLSPSRLYSVVRLLPNKQGYDVPVEGDWVTIAVVAERGPLRYTKAPVGIGKYEKEPLPEEDDVKSLLQDQPLKPANSNWQSFNSRKGKAKEAEAQKPSGKKYISLKLIDFGCRVQSSASGGKAIIRGDAFLSLLLFEADRVDVVERDDGAKEKVYKGGSRGAFEKLSKLKEGSVVAFLNPRILKPFQRSGDTPHPTDNILAITPDSADAIAIIGHSQDLGMCSAIKRDGKRCGAWCDKRVSDVCEYHIQHAVQGKRAGRAEFSAGTSGMTSAAKRKPDYDPARQWGLKPDLDRSEGTGATYVVSGHVVSGGKSSLFISETLGRDAQAKAARKVAARDADHALQHLLKKDREGTRAVKAARDFGKKMMSQDVESRHEHRKGKKRVEGDDTEEDDDDEKPAKNAYSASLIKGIGFDPTGKSGRHVKDAEVEKKLRTLASLQASRKGITLGPRPGKLKSTVRAPDKLAARINAEAGPSKAGSNPTADGRSESPLLRIPDSDDEAVASAEGQQEIGQDRNGKTVRPNPTIPERSGPVGMVDLESSDVEY
ncbi:hypothetical protein NM688_g5519 [Phlebia brevispora]|uniref:Uncharacterized protein n=1 Tax=Phlebia brevispora TaxID=194682 RepID=A0ACC1SU94_9APHY|nr:hypothetical protein NM688_g5519 [Phlebia brevispora]